MSYKLVQAVLASPTPKGSRLRMCLVALAEHTNGDHPERGCFPSQVTLARECGVGERAIRDTLGELETAGFLVVDRSKRKHVFHVRPGAPYRQRSSGSDRTYTGTPLPVSGHDGGTALPAVPGSLAHVTGTPLPVDTGTPLPPNQKGTRTEPETEPERAQGAREPERSVGLDRDEGKTGMPDPLVSSLVARLVAAGERDPAASIGTKLEALVADLGPPVVERLVGDMEAETASRPVRTPLGWVKAAGERVRLGTHRFTASSSPAPQPPARVGRPTPGKAYPVASVEKYVAAGTAARGDFQPNRDLDATDAPWVFAPRPSAPAVVQAGVAPAGVRTGEPQPIGGLYQHASP